MKSKTTIIFIIGCLSFGGCTVSRQLSLIRSDLDYIKLNCATKTDFSKLDSLYRNFSTIRINEQQQDIEFSTDTLSKNSLKRALSRPIKDF